jgi:hypothetical protein
LNANPPHDPPPSALHCEPHVVFTHERRSLRFCTPPWFAAAQLSAHAWSLQVSRQAKSDAHEGLVPQAEPCAQQEEWRQESHAALFGDVKPPQAPASRVEPPPLSDEEQARRMAAAPAATSSLLKIGRIGLRSR